MDGQHHHHHYHAAVSAAQPENEQEEAYELDDVSEKASTASHQRHPVQDEEEAGGDKIGAGAPLEPVKSKASVNNVSTIPNGGLKAWLQVLGAFFLLFNTWYAGHWFRLKTKD